VSSDDKRWGVFIGDDDDHHIIPIGDLIAHVETRRCACGPAVEVEDNGVCLVIHDAFDERPHE
jgi:hypothetical protein